MRIAFDAKRVFTNLTGLGNYSRFMIQALSEYFPENEYILYTPRKQPLAQVDQTFLQSSNLTVKTPSRFINQMRLNSLWRSYMLGNTASKEGVQLFHGLSNELPFLNKPHLKKVVTIHDVLFLRHPELYNPIDVQIYKRKCMHACKVADRIIAVSKQTAEDIMDFFQVDRNKIDVVYQGCQPSFKLEEESTGLEFISEKYKLPTDFILNVGTIEPRKNTLLILKALVRLKTQIDIPLVIVGHATRYKKELVEYAEKEQISDRIIFLHNVNSEDLSKIYQLAQIFIYPSIFEGFGIPIIEAINSGVPVITSKGSCFSEAGGPDSLYVDPYNAEELAEAILKVLQNTQLAAKMRNNSLQYVKQFESQHIADQLMEVYKKAIEA